MREIDMGTDRDLFSEGPDGLPVYEGRMVDAFDHRAKAYVSGRGRAAEWVAIAFGDPVKSICPQWYVRPDALPAKLGARPYRYRIGFCNVGSPTNERTLVAALIPKGAVCGHAVPTIEFQPEWRWSYGVWLAVANSFVMDYLVRQKATLNMTFTILDSLPFPRLTRDHPRARTIVELAALLTCSSVEMNDYWDSLANEGWVPARTTGSTPPGLQDEQQRLHARAQLDVIVASDLFGLNREQLTFILDTFPTVRKYDEAAHGEYRTKRLILEIYDEMQLAGERCPRSETAQGPSPTDPIVVHP
jgi:hypothetical protein